MKNSDLKPATQQWFDQTAEHFAMDPAQRRVLLLAAQAWDRSQQARAILATEGIVVEDRFGQRKQHPAIAIERDSRWHFAKLLRELGMALDPPEVR